MSIKLPGATNGSVEIDVPAAIGSDLSVTIPATAGELTVKATDGSVDLGDVNIDSSGRLLVGTSSASESFSALLQNASGDSFGILGLAANTATPADNSVLGDIRWSDSGHTLAAMIRCRRDGGTWSGSSKPTRLEFSTTADGASSPTEAMRINRNQIVFIYTAYTYNAVGSTRDVYVQSDGAIGYVSSVREHKTNITNLENIDWLYDLNPVEFNRRKRDEDLNYLDEYYPEKEYGLIADEVKAVQPEMCFYDELEDGTQKLAGVHYRQLITPMLKALQQANARIEALEAEVTAIKGGAS